MDDNNNNNNNTIIRLDDPSFEMKEQADQSKAPAEPADVKPVVDTTIPAEPAEAATPIETAAPAETAAPVDVNPVVDTTIPAAETPEVIAIPTADAAAPTETPAIEIPAVETSVEPAAAEVKAPADPAAPYEPAHAASEGPAHAAPVPPRNNPPKKAKSRETKYVTRGVLVTFMVITMIVSTIFGAIAGMLFSRSSSGTVKQRVDSELSQLNLSDATGSEMTVSEIVQKNEDSVVEIVVSGTSQGMWGQLELVQGAGSGVIVKEDGYIATNYHVIDGATKVEVTLHNGNTYDARIVGSDSLNDIAVIKIEASDLVPVTIGDSSTLNVGDLAVAIGNPLGQLGGTATTGIISALDRNLTIEGTPLTLIQTDAAINGGNSGGGLFNSKGELIGIVESKASAVGVEGLAFALPINTVSGIINDLIENGGTEKTAEATPAVGIVISEVSEDNAEYYGLDKAGVYIAQVTGANAMKAGFQERDRVVSIDGREVTSSNEFIGLVRKHKVGDTVTIVVERNGQEMEIKTELEALSDTGSSQPNEP